MPNVVGLTEEKAKSDIEKLGLVVETEYRDLTSSEKEYPKGYVIAQEPNANSSSKVAEGTTIKVYVVRVLLTILTAQVLQSETILKIMNLQVMFQFGLTVKRSMKAVRSISKKRAAIL